MVKALFLDRDGVIDELVYYADVDSWDAPRNANDVRLRPGVAEALALAAQHGWMMFVVSNQPDAAKKKTTYEGLEEAHHEILKQLGGAPIRAFFYCRHRSEDHCRCRKPKPFLVQQAAEHYGVDLSQSWFVGDADTDIECGRRAGCRTALIEYEHSKSKRGSQRPDWVCGDLGEFVRKLVEQT